MPSANRIPQPVVEGHVHIVDDDPDFRAAVTDLLDAEALSYSVYASTEALLATELAEEPACLVLDVQLPGASGLDLQLRLQQLDQRIPIIFMTAHGDVDMCARVMKRGASEFLTKPLSGDRLLAAVRTALAEDRQRGEQRLATQAASDVLRSLTARELDVMALVSQGLLNKQIAGRLDISEVTVKMHRGNAMRKFGVRSVARMMTMLAQLPSDALAQARSRVNAGA